MLTVVMTKNATFGMAIMLMVIMLHVVRVIVMAPQRPLEESLDGKK